MITERTKQIKSWIQNRKTRGEKPTCCIFQITIPKFISEEVGYGLADDEDIKQIINILNKYNIAWRTVDTISGAFNLNRDWIETSQIPCYIEYCGVYPTEWDIEDVCTLEEMEYEGKVIIKVLWCIGDEYIPNH